MALCREWCCVPAVDAGLSGAGQGPWAAFPFGACPVVAGGAGRGWPGQHCGGESEGTHCRGLTGEGEGPSERECAEGEVPGELNVRRLPRTRARA